MTRFFHHLFIPRHTNNFRARILHNSAISVVALLFFVFTIGIQFIKTNNPEVLGISYAISTQELLDETNQERTANGLQPLTFNSLLQEAAERKAQHMMINHYWAHFAPDGTTPWKFIKDSGYQYAYAGENLAKGFTNSSDVVTAWMNSPSHRENILSNKYNDIGFAILEGNLDGEDTVLVVQMFGSTDKLIVTQSEGSIPREANAPQITIEKQVLPQQIASVPLVNSQDVTKTIGIVVLLFLGTILVLDFLIIERKKIPRLAGHNMDHVILIVFFLLFIWASTNKGIL